jgi:serine/threonine protein kinase
MKWLSDNVLAKLQSGLGAPVNDDPETEVDLHLKGQIFGDRFAIDQWLGSGGMGTVYRAVDLETNELAVVKLIHPSFVGRDGKGAALAVLKEATALGALGVGARRSPNVVRLLGTGTIVADVLAGETLELPWIAIEYVAGGPDGTNLEERVGHAVRTTGYGFEVARGIRAIEGIAKGIEAVHAAQVVHRDIKPANILSSGEGSSEVYKLADFGVSRPLGVAGTFGGLLVGTPGYAPPELMSIAEPEIGPWTDVFGFASLIYFLLGGDHYFPLSNIRDSLRAVRSAERRSLGEARCVHPELRNDDGAIKVIDEALAKATLAPARMRTQSATELAEPVLRALRRVGSRKSLPSIGIDSGFRWSVRRPPKPADIAISGAFDGRSRCLVRTPDGVFLFSGDRFGDQPLEGCANLPPIRFVERIGEARWLVGGERATFAVCGERGIEEVVKGADESVTFELFNGELGDLGILVGAREGGAPALYALVGRHWLKPLPLQDSPTLSGIARVDATRWMLAGKVRGDRPFCALYAPLGWDVARIKAEGRSPITAVAGDVARRIGLAVALDGTAIVVGQGEPAVVRVQDGAKLNVAHVDAVGRLWAGGAGRLWVRAPSENVFHCVFEADDEKPFVALSSEGDTLLALTSDFVIVKGRAESTKKGIGVARPP